MVVQFQPSRLPLRATKALLALCCAALLPLAAQAGPARPAAERKSAPAPVRGGDAEARLIEVYRLVGQSRTRDALAKAEALVGDLQQTNQKLANGLRESTPMRR